MSYNHGTIYYIYGARSLDRNQLCHLAQHQVGAEVDRQLIILVMELITIFMGLSAVISASFAIWLNTKSGQKLIDEL